ncbi:unnamed protein product [Rangifer tarandus platyrhynchus]|uniref:Uncharacterized protein n=2 Tax=Rangifer tarandus platyrhynchus TaxID=3082113 RepID=A0ABN8YFY9_RANTA|nr:unnamed protein product [Rangifer tarandus platyrhynchus]CAI9699232.1 unnamed protein product [Rangifer tarandus platyrhynchus]
MMKSPRKRRGARSRTLPTPRRGAGSPPADSTQNPGRTRNHSEPRKGLSRLGRTRGLWGPSEDAESQGLDFWEGSQQDTVVDKTRGRLDCEGGHSGQKTSLRGSDRLAELDAK